MGRRSQWTPAQDAELLRLRDIEHRGIVDIAARLGKSKSCIHRRYDELRPCAAAVSDASSLAPSPALAGEGRGGGERGDCSPPAPPLSAFAPLHRRLGILTHTHRQAILNDPRLRDFDQITSTWNQNHLYRASVTLPGPDLIEETEMRNHPWTDHDLERLAALYPVRPMPELLIEFAPHTRRSIETAAARLGVHRGTPWGAGKGRQPTRKRRDWRRIANEHAPRIALARPVPAEVTR